MFGWLLTARIGCGFLACSWHHSSGFSATNSANCPIFPSSDRHKAYSLLSILQAFVSSGQSRDRTGDLRIFSPSLYQLSYLSFIPTFSACRAAVNLYGQIKAVLLYPASRPLQLRQLTVKTVCKVGQRLPPCPDDDSAAGSRPRCKAGMGVTDRLFKSA